MKGELPKTPGQCGAVVFTLALVLRAIGVPKAAAARLAALPEEEVELPEVLRTLKAQ